MTSEKWEKIIGNIKDGFTVREEGNVHLDEDGGIDVEYIEFNGPMGRMRLEFITKPVVLGKKTTYSRRIGSETAVEYIYSESEKSQTLIAYKWDEERGEWGEIDARSFSSDS